MSSAFEDQMCSGMNNVPDKILERAYWRRKLPPAFRFYLEMLCKELMVVQPTSTYQHAANFFQELLLQRDKELSLLPYVSYLQTLKSRRGFHVPTPEESRPPTRSPVSSVKCSRCGRAVPSISAATTTTAIARSPMSVSVCSSGRTSKASTYNDGLLPQPPTSPHCLMGQDLVCDGNCQVITLPLKKDPYGKLVHRVCPMDADDHDLIACRELATLLDY